MFEAGTGVANQTWIQILALCDLSKASELISWSLTFLIYNMWIIIAEDNYEY